MPGLTSSARSRTHAYRSEIDGLRAVAVLPVVFFHAGFSSFRGGYLGVDVFFVVSGYLICSIIVTERSTATFSLRAFYERRARRILPALFLVLFASLPFAWAWMMPEQLRRFALSLIATLLFSSNMLFWHWSGYFERAAIERPLLHTWSLGVEEQFYLLFPLLIALGWRAGLRVLVWLLCFMCAASFMLGAWYFQHSAGFYLAPARAWQLLLGSILAIVPLGAPSVFAPKQPWSEAWASGGLLLIVVAILFTSESMPFPNLGNAAATIGTALVLAFAREGTIVCRLLSTRGLVSLGLISYSAYLWHQPLFAFARLQSLSEPSWTVFATLTILALTLAYLSWRFVELPFRDRTRVSSRMLVQFTLIAGLGLFGIGVTCQLEDGFRVYQQRQAAVRGYRLPNIDAEVNHRERLLTQSKERLLAPFLGGTTTRILVIGDSHSSDIELAYLTNEKAFDTRYQVRATLYDESCFDRTLSAAHSSKCVEARKILFGSAGRALIEGAEYILVAVRWTPADVPRVRPLMQELGSAGSKLVLVGRTAEFFDVPSLLARTTKSGSTKTIAELERILGDYRVKQIDEINALLKHEASRLGLLYLDKKDLICRGDRCSFLDDSRSPYFFDYGHWSIAGAKHFGEVMLTTNWLPQAKRGT